MLPGFASRGPRTPSTSACASSGGNGRSAINRRKKIGATRCSAISVRVDVGVEVPGIARARRASGRRTPAARPTCDVELLNAGIGQAGLDDRRHARREPAVRDMVGDRFEVADDPLVVIVRLGWSQHLLEAGDRIGDEIELAGPVAVDGCLAGPGSARDRLDGERPVPGLGQLVERRFEDRRARPLDARVDRRVGRSFPTEHVHDRAGDHGDRGGHEERDVDRVGERHPAASTDRGPVRRRAGSPTPTAPPIDSPATSAASAGRPVESNAAPVLDATMLPSTAMPSAPPNSRVVSLTAEPTPALLSGTDDMIAPVAGAIVIAMPVASSTKPTRMNRYGVSGCDESEQPRTRAPST